MATIYAKEMPHFLDSIGNVPKEMVDLAYDLLKK